MKTIIKNIQKEIGSAKVVVACSTGVDSMVLLDLVLKALPISQIIVCHVNHKIREASEAEQKFITKYSINHGLKLFVKQLIQYKGASYENWARNERYTFFNETAITQNATYILTAHQADDQFETILMRMLKGGNLKSYSGISELSKNGNIYIYRPLLTVSKEQIYEYARNNHITYYEDETNAKKVIDPGYAWIIPDDGNSRPVKVACEGDTIVDEYVNADRSRELQVYKKVGVGVMVTNNICVYEDTSLKGKLDTVV